MLTNYVRVIRSEKAQKRKNRLPMWEPIAISKNEPEEYVRKDKDRGRHKKDKQSRGNVIPDIEPLLLAQALHFCLVELRLRGLNFLYFLTLNNVVVFHNTPRKKFF